MEECHEFFNCKALTCCKHKNTYKACWDCDATMCKTHNSAVEFLREGFDNKNDACKLCLYYKLSAEE